MKVLLLRVKLHLKCPSKLRGLVGAGTPAPLSLGGGMGGGVGKVYQGLLPFNKLLNLYGVFLHPAKRLMF